MIKKCELCGKEFKTKGYAKYCVDCRMKVIWSKRRKKRPKIQIEKTCPTCGKQFVSSLLNRVYCSKECFIQHRMLLRGRIKKVCDKCGKVFFTNTDKIYCKDCSGKKQQKEKVITNCEECGKEFIKKRKNQRFCCSACLIKNKNKMNRKITIKTCKVCGKKFESSKKFILYCSEECKKVVQKERIKMYNEKARERWRKSRKSKREREEKKRSGNNILVEINKISKETGLSYGEVKKWYPDMNKIKFMASYLGRKGMDANEVRSVGRTSMIIV